MPHVIAKLYTGRSEKQKARLAAEIVKDVVAIDEVSPEEWPEKVYRPEILADPQGSRKSRAPTRSRRGRTRPPSRPKAPSVPNHACPSKRSL